ncbi:farnesol dehydrogenase-like [Anastrepha ludens]|uniref:farnesol dehydrogenase-like n=1 Tax=Anastrepha ludens TaxID=28586 RepID=UPI0023AFBB50|nr:farnesol dehydrogenase-like [Anastrepha ludens]
MERWVNRVAVVTGASSGIGAAVAKYLANNGLITVGLDLCKTGIETLRDELNAEARERIHAIQCDIRSEEQIIAAFKEIERTYGPVAVLVNNAGITRLTTLLAEDSSQDIRDVVDTNIMGAIYCTREAFRSMKANGEDGHVFLINSIVGHRVPILPNSTLNIYPSTKHAITALTEMYRQEFLNQKTNIKITSISPGIVDTSIYTEEIKKEMLNFSSLKRLKANDIADALVYCLQTPPHVQIHELIIKPMGEML